MPSVRLLSRPDCGLCHEFASELARVFGRRVAVEIVDVDREPPLRLRYGRLIPVLVDAESQPICITVFDRDAVAAWLARQPV
ncbi:MAG: glutaredoxin family protein [Gammaproteobacteria bacterium]|nr:glutaredoxin family protein [Gammaproteobacteria bacterium]